MLAIYVIVNPDSKPKDGEDEPFIFLFLHQLHKMSATTVLNQAINSVKAHVIKLHEDATSHCVRYGGLADISRNVDLQFIYGIFRGDWYFQGECTALHYADKDPGCLEAGKALAGWKCTKWDIPSIDPMDHLDHLLGNDAPEHTKARFENLASDLFSNLPFSRPGEQLYDLRNIFFGAVIEMAPQVINDLACMRQNDDFEEPLHNKLKAAVIRKHFSWEDDFLVWSRKVRFSCKNLKLSSAQFDLYLCFPGQETIF